MARETLKYSSKRTEKRKTIIDAAIKHFAMKGFHETKICDIAETAKVADGTVYIYFENKDDLLIKALEEVFNERLGSIKKKVSKEKNPIEKLEKFVRLNFDLFRSQPYMVRFFAQELRQSPEFYKKYPTFTPLKNYLDFISSMVKEAQVTEQVREMDINAAALLIFGSMEFLAAQWSLNKSFEYDIKEKVDQIWDIIYQGIRKI